jgi:hypothetical protein
MDVDVLKAECAETKYAKKEAYKYQRVESAE